MGGRGVTIIAAFQSRAQLLDRYGPHKTATILNNTASVMLFGGTRDRDDLQFWSTLAGERDERITTTDLHGRVASPHGAQGAGVLPGPDREPGPGAGDRVPPRHRPRPRPRADGLAAPRRPRRRGRLPGRGRRARAPRPGAVRAAGHSSTAPRPSRRGPAPASRRRVGCWARRRWPGSGPGSGGAGFARPAWTRRREERVRQRRRELGLERPWRRPEGEPRVSDTLQVPSQRLVVELEPVPEPREQAVDEAPIERGER